MKLSFAIVAILAVVLVSQTQAQRYYRLFSSGFGPYLRQPSVSSLYQPSSGFYQPANIYQPSNVYQPASQQVAPGAYRDPRANTGPVLFPPNPPSDNPESSGVIVGASGYGFVPPNAAWLAYFYA